MEVDKRENEDEFKLVLELSKTDPLFQKKKKLLEDMGFDLASPVSVKSSSNPDQLKNYLNILLQQARIINFNEVGLYFGGDVVNVGDVNTPRNELEALHSIAEAIDKPICSRNSHCKLKYKEEFST